MREFNENVNAAKCELRNASFSLQKRKVLGFSKVRLSTSTARYGGQLTGKLRPESQNYENVSLS